MPTRQTSQATHRLAPIRQARQRCDHRCWQAQGSRCRCLCKGTLHAISDIPFAIVINSLYQQVLDRLAPDDDDDREHPYLIHAQ